jgi:hypothetical protein
VGAGAGEVGVAIDRFSATRASSLAHSAISAACSCRRRARKDRSSAYSHTRQKQNGQFQTNPHTKGRNDQLHNSI